MRVKLNLIIQNDDVCVRKKNRVKKRRAKKNNKSNELWKMNSGKINSEKKMNLIQEGEVE